MDRFSLSNRSTITSTLSSDIALTNFVLAYKMETLFLITPITLTAAGGGVTGVISVHCLHLLLAYANSQHIARIVC
eukprot:12800359-Ditylum_brightwellii.AAC.1